jgi:hypothetical protein
MLSSGDFLRGDQCYDSNDYLSLVIRCLIYGTY